MKPDKILTIAAHPDDEIIGMGGTIKKFTKNGSNARAIVACSKSMLHLKNNEFSQLHAQAKAASKIIGYTDIHFLDFTDQKLDTVPLLVLTQSIEKILYSYKPDYVFIHHPGDINNDHKVLFDAALVAVRPINDYIKNVFAYETLSSTEWGFPNTFRPDTYIDISSTFDAKCEAMSEYKLELRSKPHPRSLEIMKSRAEVNGSTIGCKYAERFQTVWRVQR